MEGARGREEVTVTAIGAGVASPRYGLGQKSALRNSGNNHIRVEVPSADFDETLPPNSREGVDLIVCQLCNIKLTKGHHKAYPVRTSVVNI